ncbi:hypothetical protein MACJ_002854 [Theileria orientalis]|uniref:Cyclin n=1 Tax=Theileria orientalis TaxID=68886 RepID=A0A976M6S9_THEOR|nr:hypothetical protein MACJ_002854 [Theileria orientalis]
MDCVVRATGDEFIRTLGVVLTKIVSDVAPEYGPISCFNSMNAPPISDYLTRIARYVNCSNECFVLALVYIDRIMRLHRFSVSVLNIHRLLITSVMLAAKFSDDVYYSNSFYAQVGGIKVAEMNQLEAQFLILINYHLFVDARDYENCRKGVESSSTKIYTLAGTCPNGFAKVNQCKNTFPHKGMVHTGAMPSSNYGFNKYQMKNANNNLLIKGKDIKRCYKPAKCQVVKTGPTGYVTTNVNANIGIHGINGTGMEPMGGMGTNVENIHANVANIKKNSLASYMYKGYAPRKGYEYSENSYVDTTYMDGYLVYQYGMDYPYSRTESSITVSTSASFDHGDQVTHHMEPKHGKCNNAAPGRLDNKLDECEAFVNALENRYKDTLKRKCSSLQQFALVKNHW